MSGNESDRRSEPERLDLRSMSITEDRIAKLREDFPEVFREEKIDFDALKRSLGEWVDPGKERFGLNWPGKAECMRIIQEPSVGTLIPMREESVDFDTTQNVIIEGENLEVLKLLQKSYYGKVKMIYIDPPYNTGKEFIYPDNFKEGLQDYLRYSGQTDGNGFKLSTNTESEGRYHSKWLNMMYPRLFLARNLLSSDGVIFVSIDEHEVANLRMLLNEVFGEEQFIVQIIWKKRSTPPNDQIIGANHEYILVYGRNTNQVVLNLRERNTEQLARYKNPDNHPKGPWTPGDLMGNVKGGRYVESLYYPIQNPNTGEDHYPSSNGNWRFNRHRVAELLENNEIYFGENGNGRPKLKRFLSEVKEGITYPTIWDFVPLNTEGSTEMTRLLGSLRAFENPKPSDLLKELIKLGSANDALVLDFFAGSGTFGHATVACNADDGGNRRYILIQLPESTDNEFETIANVARVRMRRVIEQEPKCEGARSLGVATKQPGCGFRSYRLATSNFRPWKGKLGQGDTVERQLEIFSSNLVEERSAEDVLTEILLRSGFELTDPVEELEVRGQTVFSVADGAMLVCLERPLTLEVIEAMAALDPGQIVVLDAGFANNDQLKVNAMQAIATRARGGQETIAFKVV